MGRVLAVGASALVLLLAGCSGTHTDPAEGHYFNPGGQVQEVPKAALPSNAKVCDATRSFLLGYRSVENNFNEANALQQRYQSQLAQLGPLAASKTLRSEASALVAWFSDRRVVRKNLYTDLNRLRSTCTQLGDFVLPWPTAATTPASVT